MSIPNQRRQQILTRLGIERLPPLTMMGDYENQMAELQRPMVNLDLDRSRRLESFGQDFSRLTNCQKESAEEEGETGPFRNYMTVPARKCSKCEDDGQTVWVIPGKCCPRCGTYIEG